jgi:hypothetical protein
MFTGNVPVIAGLRKSLIIACAWLAVVGCLVTARADWVQTGGPEVGHIARAASTSSHTVAWSANGALGRRAVSGGVWTMGAAGWPAGANFDLAATHASFYAVMNRTTLLKSSDGGATWTELPLPGEFGPLASIDRLWLVGAGTEMIVIATRLESLPALAMRVSEAGGPAAFFTLPTPGGLSGGVLAVAGSALLWFESLNVHRSVDGGATWQLIPDAVLPLNFWQPMLSEDGLLLVQAMFGGTIMRSIDDGLTFEAVATNGLTSTLTGMARIGRVIVGFNDAAVFRSMDGGENWQAALLEGLPPFALNGFASFAAGGALHTSTYDRGLWRTDDLGDHWFRDSAGFIDLRVSRVSSIGSVLLAAGQQGRPTFRSTDNGATWQEIEQLHNIPINDFFQLDANTVLAATSGSGLLRSDDFGVTWTPSNAGLPMLDPSSGTFEYLTRIARVGEALFVGTGGAFIFVANGSHCACSGMTSGKGVYRSLNGGQSWQPVVSGLPLNGFDGFNWQWRQITALSVVGDAVLAATPSHGIFRSTNLGASWQLMPGSPTGASTWVQDLETVNGDAFALTTLNTPMFKSLGGSSAWSPLNSIGLPPQTSFVDLLAVGGDLYVGGSDFGGTSAGVYKSSNGGATFGSVGSALQAIAVSSLHATGGRILAGTAGRGVWRLEQGIGDVNGDGSVDVDDLIAVILAWGACPAPPQACPADVNLDGTVDVDDLIIVVLNWG